MRVSEFIRANEETVNEVEEFKQQAAIFKEAVEHIFTLMDEEEKNQVLDRYKEDWEYLKKL
jgi:hypothetical protein